MSTRRVIILVDDDDNEVEIKLGSREILRWEEANNRSVQELEHAGMAGTYELVHFIAQRRGLFKGDLEKFKNTYDIEEPTSDAGPKGSK